MTAEEAYGAALSAIKKSGYNYSLEERKIGKWLGKDLYEIIATEMPADYVVITETETVDTQYKIFQYLKEIKQFVKVVVNNIFNSDKCVVSGCKRSVGTVTQRDDGTECNVTNGDHYLSVYGKDTKVGMIKCTYDLTREDFLGNTAYIFACKVDPSTLDGYHDWRGSNANIIRLLNLSSDTSQSGVIDLTSLIDPDTPYYFGFHVQTSYDGSSTTVVFHELVFE